MIFTARCLMTEDELQKHVVDWLKASLPMGSVVHHSPNEGQRHVAYKVRLKSLGMITGWPDLEIFVPDTGWIDLACKGPIMFELKRPQGGRLTDKQKDIQDKLRCCGVYCVTAKRLSQVQAYLQPLLHLRDTPQARITQQICEAQGG